MVPAARVISMAANPFNFDLRSYYFGMTILLWFVNPWRFMLMSAGWCWCCIAEGFIPTFSMRWSIPLQRRHCLKLTRSSFDEYSVLVCVH
jgi:uncharacterized membrane protein